MNIATALFFLLILACPLMMIFMMRGHGHGNGGEHEHRDPSATSVDELRRQRDELDREIAARADTDPDEDGWRSPWDASPRADGERGTHETNHRRALTRR